MGNFPLHTKCTRRSRRSCRLNQAELALAHSVIRPSKSTGAYLVHELLGSPKKGFQRTDSLMTLLVKIHGSQSHH